MSSSQTELELLITRAKKDENNGFRQLYEALIDRVYAYTRSRVSAKEDALDCTQQVFIELWKGLQRFEYRTDAQFYGFLFTITKRQIMKIHEERRRAPTDLGDEYELEAAGIDHETEQLIESGLSTLSEVDKNILILHHWSRYTFGEIGEMLMLTESNVRVRHHRALKSLEAYLDTTQ